jgi:hypothetical protein
MVRERRLHRRLLGEAFVGFLRAAAASGVRSRVVQSPCNVVYLFVAVPRDRPAEQRGALLKLYGAVLRDQHPDAVAVVGILTEIPDGDWANTLMLVVLDGPVTDELRDLADEGRRLGLLAGQVYIRGTRSAYPDASE